MSDLCKVEVVPVSLTKHPDADNLSIVRVFDGYTVVVRTADWEGKTKGAYIPPDNVVPGDRDEFKFLDGSFRIKARKFRGVMSQGLLVEVPDNFNVGDDVTEFFGVTRYVPAGDLESGDPTFGPPDFGPKYDIESWFKYRSVFQPGESVVITEKIHGTNARYTFQEGKMWAASRSLYRTDGEGLYWRVVKENPWIEEFCRAWPGVHLYGEIYGSVQELKYGAAPGQLWFRVFDVYDRGSYWNTARVEFEVEYYAGTKDALVPALYRGPYSEEIVTQLMDGTSSLAPHIKEGVVIKTYFERWTPTCGRVILKAVSPEYLAKKK